ncbi:MAG: hypothetical protein KDK05_03875 [Candidatus Competibacteraceae bacterium]|nr:hypothetical protein [Candidatus Competibacteraceae bacterium]
MKYKLTITLELDEESYILDSLSNGIGIVEVSENSGDTLKADFAMAGFDALDVLNDDAVWTIEAMNL